MRVMLTPKPKPDGGPGVLLTKIANELVKRNIEVTSNPLSLWNTALVNISGRRLRLLKSIAIGRRVAYRVAGWYIPEVYEALGREFEPIFQKWNAKTKHGLAHADVVIYQSHWAKGSLDRLFHRRDRFAVIYNGTDLTTFSPSPHNSFMGDKSIAVLGTCGNLRFPERINVLRRISVHMQRRHLFLVIGKMNAACQKIAHEIESDRRLAPCFRFVGYLPNDELPDMYRKMHCLIHPVPGDTCPNTVVEALASGVPVVTLGEGGAGEIAADAGINIHGSLIDFSDEKIDAMAHAIEKVLDSHSQYAKAARQRAIDTLDINSTVEQYLKLLR